MVVQFLIKQYANNETNLTLSKMAQKCQGWGTKIKKSQSSFENFFWEHIISSMGHIRLPKYTSGTE